MKVAMLGWEYPPHISGGLGTACEGLTRSLAPLGVDISFVVPRVYGNEAADHMRLTDPTHVGAPAHPRKKASGVVVSTLSAGTTEVAIDAALSPYWRSADYHAWLDSDVVGVGDVGDTAPTPTTAMRVASAVRPVKSVEPAAPRAPDPAASRSTVGFAPRGRPEHYAKDLFREVARYAHAVHGWGESQRFDVVHAHDWMTFPAGIALADQTGAPLVVHVHSLEVDRSGAGGEPRIIAIERAGLTRADRVVAVSHYTSQMIQMLHGVPGDKIEVVHNGVYTKDVVESYRSRGDYPGLMVLFLGRVTFQKGPDYFVEAAARVIPHIPDVTFVMAGDGDMLPRLKQRVRELGIEANFRFPGFARGAEVERLFSSADAYVMPSVSEPFGITALEAMSFDTPIIISRQSGAAELLRHALKVDFWDVERLASLMVSVLTYPELRESLTEMARVEVRRVHWDAAATKLRRLYSTLTEN